MSAGVGSLRQCRGYPFPSGENTVLKRLSTYLIGSTFAVAASGCLSTLTGAGEMGLGYRSETKVFAYHSVDGDKEGKQSVSELDLEPLLDLILKYREGREDEAPADPFPDSD